MKNRMKLYIDKEVYFIQPDLFEDDKFWIVLDNSCVKYEIICNNDESNLAIFEKFIKTNGWENRKFKITS